MSGVRSVFMKSAMQGHELLSYLDKLRSLDLFEKECWLLPTNLSETHWILLVYYPRRSLLHVYDSMHDSMHGKGGLDLETLRLSFHKGLNLLGMWRGQQTHPWVQCIELRTDTPVQKDGFNCGVFVCCFMEQLLVSWPTEPNLSLEFDADSERQRIRKRLEGASDIVRQL